MTNKKKPTEILKQNNSISIDKINDPIKVEITKTLGEKEEFLRKNAVAIVSGLISIIVSIIALYFTIWQSGKIREHNKLSVTPIIKFNYFNNTENSDFQIKITNKGTGPAIIDNLLFVTNSNKSFSSKELHGKFWYTILKSENIPDSVVHKNINHYYLDSLSAISVNEELNLFYLTVKGISKQDYDKTMGMINNCSIYVDYHSVYNVSYKDSIKFHVE